MPYVQTSHSKYGSSSIPTTLEGASGLALPDKPAPSTVLPSIKCTAHSKITGEPMRELCETGKGRVSFAWRRCEAGPEQGCRKRHLATLLKNDPRPPWEVIADAVATADALAQPPS
jgi:hypothetical protein